VDGLERDPRLEPGVPGAIVGDRQCEFDALLDPTDAGLGQPERGFGGQRRPDGLAERPPDGPAAHRPADRRPVGRRRGERERERAAVPLPGVERAAGTVLGDEHRFPVGYRLPVDGTAQVQAVGAVGHRTAGRHVDDHELTVRDREAPPGAGVPQHRRVDAGVRHLQHLLADDGVATHLEPAGVGVRRRVVGSVGRGPGQTVGAAGQADRPGAERGEEGTSLHG
jgi:hypothetical protein